MDMCNVLNLDKTIEILKCSKWWDDAENNIWDCWDTKYYYQVVAWQYITTKGFSHDNSVTSI